MRAHLPVVLVVAVVTATLFGGSRQALAEQPPTVTVNQIDASSFPAITLYVTVADSEGRPISGLTSDRFAVLEDGKPTSDVNLGTVGSQGEPLTLAMALDISDSMDGTPLAEAKAAASEFIDGLGDDDRVAILSFGTEVHKVQDLTSDKAALKNAVSDLRIGGRTALYEAMYQAATTVTGQQGRKAFVVLTDGQDYRAVPRSLDDALAKAKESGAPAFGLGFGIEYPFHPSPMEQLASATGGTYQYRPGVQGISEMFTLLGRQIRGQYVLTYRSSVAPDGKEHEITVEATTDGGKATHERTFLPVRGVGMAAISTPVRSVTQTMPLSGNLAARAMAMAATPPAESEEAPAAASRRLLLGLVALLALLSLAAVAVVARGRRTRDPVQIRQALADLYEEPTGRYGEQQYVEDVLAPTIGEPPPVADPEPTIVLKRADEPLAWLVALDGPHKGREFQLSGTEILIGRDPESAIALESEAVSRFHAKIRRKGTEYWLHDMGARNPTQVNGAEIDKRRLEDGDRIAVGDTTLVFKQV